MTEAESTPQEQAQRMALSGATGDTLDTTGGTLLTEDDIDDFIADLQKSRRELYIARQQFENVIDPRLIDHVVFRLGAAERHFSYLLQLAKQLNISVKERRWDWTEDERY